MNTDMHGSHRKIHRQKGPGAVAHSLFLYDPYMSVFICVFSARNNLLCKTMPHWASYPLAGEMSAPQRDINSTIYFAIVIRHFPFNKGCKRKWDSKPNALMPWECRRPRRQAGAHIGNFRINQRAAATCRVFGKHIW